VKKAKEEMKLFDECLIVVLLIFHCTNCVSSKEIDDKKDGLKQVELQSGPTYFFDLIESRVQPNKPMQAMAKGIVDIVKAYYIEPQINFDIHVYPGLPVTTVEQIEHVIQAWHNDKVTDSHPVLMKRRKMPCIVCSALLERSALIFIDILDAPNFINYAHTQNRFTTNLRYVLFIERLPGFKSNIFWDLEDLKPFIPRNNGQPVAPYIDFIFKEDGTLSLWTITWFEPCGTATYKRLNDFDMNALEWTKELKFGEKFKDMNNCVLDVAINMPDGSKDIAHLQAEAKLMQFVAERLNFGTININNCKSCDIFIGVFWDVDENLAYATVTALFKTDQFVFAISEAECYTSYEKILLPFDELTWYLLTATFGFAFGAIFVVSRMSRRWQDIVYGEGVRVPAFNVLGTFFGIGQLRLPTTFFARAILTFFTWFCLIFRTAYQGVFYELMTTDMRKPQPKTFNDLIERNYTIFGQRNRFLILAIQHQINIFSNNKETCTNPTEDNYNELINSIKNNMDYRVVPGRFECTDSHSYDNICDILRDSSAKTAYLFTLESIQALKTECGFEPQILEEVMCEKDVGVVMPPNHYLFSFITDAAQRFVEAGILQWWDDFSKFVIYKLHPTDPEVNEPHVLTLEILSFGFIIWLSACGLAFVVFLCEIITGLIQTKIYPVREREKERSLVGKEEEEEEKLASIEEPAAAGLSIWDDSLVVEEDRVDEVVVVMEKVRIHEEVEVHVEEITKISQVGDATGQEAVATAEVSTASVATAEVSTAPVAEVSTDAVQEITPVQPSQDDDEVFVKNSKYLFDQKSCVSADHDDDKTVVDLDV
jgi:hypothetical protein